MLQSLFILRRPAFDSIYGPELLAAVADRTRLLADPLTAEEAAERPDLLARAEVLFSGWGAPVFDLGFLERAPRLRAVFYGAGSIRRIVTEEFWARDIPICSAYAMNAVPVAEYTLAAVLLGLKNVWGYLRHTRATGRPATRGPCAGAYQSRVGLVSLGMVGRLVRERLRPFDVRVVAHDPFVSAAEARELDVELLPLDEVFARADVVSLHTPLLPETRGLIRGRHFRLMKPGATFINTARGAIVNEAEMIEVLAERPDLSAVLDVTFPEPPEPGSPLPTLPNVFLTPHVAGSEGLECRRMGRLMVDEFDRWARGEKPRWAISREQSLVLA